MKIAIVLNSNSEITRTVCADKVICADGGYNFCPVTPDLIIGDGDSLTREIPENIPRIRHNPHKDDSDGTLAVEYAIDVLHATEIELFGVLGGRYDHTLGNLTLMSLALSKGVKCTALEDGLDVYIADKYFTLSVSEGDLISTIPFGGDALVRAYKGLEYPLVNLRLTGKDTIGISNVATAKEIALDVVEGEILIFHYFK